MNRCHWFEQTTLDDVRNGFWNHANEKKKLNFTKKKFFFIKSYLMQSIIGHTDKHRLQPVQSSVTSGE
jgi:hypothetical protein